MRTTRTPGMCLIELSSTETIFGIVPSPYAPWPRGRTSRPWSMPGHADVVDVDVLAA